MTAKTNAKAVTKTSTTAKAVKTVVAAPASAAKSSAPAKRPAGATRKASVAASTAASPKAAKTVKTKKVKMVRDSFTMPEHDYARLAELKKKCLKAGVHVKKSELLRAGMLGLVTLTDAALLKAVEQLEKIKTGRPAKT